MDIKPRPNHRRYIEILRAMTPARLVDKAFELTEHARQLFKDGLRNRHPNASEEELKRLYLAGLAKCHNVNY